MDLTAWVKFRTGSFFIVTFLVCIGMILIVSGDDAGTENRVPSVTVIDASAVIDTSQMGAIPIGQIPDERINLATTVANNENKLIPGLRIRSFLVKEGREDEISLQLGSDLRNVDLQPGELKTFKNSYVISKKLRPGLYKLLIFVDSNISSGMNTSDSVKYLSNQVVSIGAYANGQGSVPVYSPSKIDTPGSYLLMRDIDGGDTENIFRVTTSGVTIDGGGHTIRGRANGYTAGIYVDGQSSLQDITVKNCILEGIDFGVWLYRVSNGRVINCTFSNCKSIGLRFDQSQANTVSDNTFTGNELGIGIFQSSANIISNNYFKNKFNAAVNEGVRNTWNVAPHQGLNIIGGQTIAGNAWFDPAEGGYSESTPDSDNNGITDSPFIINGENIDYYPLSVKKTPPPMVSDSGANRTAEENTTPVQVETVEDTLKEEVGIENQTGDTGPVGPGPSLTPGVAPPVQDFADLKVTEISAPDKACLSGDIIVNTTIENTGTLEAGQFSLSYFLSENPGGVTLSDLEIGSHHIDSLKPKENQTVSDTLPIPGTMGNTLYTLGVIVDPAHDIYEENKGNNNKPVDHQIWITGC